MTYPLERLDKCPRTPECVARLVWRANNGDLFSYDSHDQNFKPHMCNVIGSGKPNLGYLGEWYNTHSKRTRWVGPARMSRSVKTPPDKNPNWIFKGLYQSPFNWVPISETDE